MNTITVYPAGYLNRKARRRAERVANTQRVRSPALRAEARRQLARHKRVSS